MELVMRVKDDIEDEEYKDIDMLTVETAEVRYDDLVADDYNCCHLL